VGITTTFIRPHLPRLFRGLGEHPRDGDARHEGVVAPHQRAFLEHRAFQDVVAGEGAQPHAREAVYAIVHWFPGAASKFFLRAGFGYVSYWNNRPGETDANGSGYVLGAGYELTRWGRWRLEPIVKFAGGGFDGAIFPPGVRQDQSYRAATLRLGVTYR
jgi:hypothetical protein